MGKQYPLLNNISAIYKRNCDILMSFITIDHFLTFFTRQPKRTLQANIKLSCIFFISNLQGDDNAQ